MRKVFSAFLIMAILISCNMSKETQNPLLTKSPLKYEAPQFDKITTDDFQPALEKAIAKAKKDVDKIVNNTRKPTFKNTIEALEYAGTSLTNVMMIFYNLNHSNTNEQMQQIAQSISPAITEYSMSIILNEKLFERIKAVYDQKDKLGLDNEDARLLEKTYKSFARNGANLSPEDKAEYSKIAEQLSLLSLDFNNNLLAATNAFTMHLTNEKDLAGLPQFVIDMAAYEAQQRDMSGWVFTLHQPSYGPFIQYSDRRDLREKMWRAYNSKCIGDQYDNRDIIIRTVDLRLKEAKLLGYETFADYVLEENMAKNKETVEEFLDNLLEKSLPFAKKDVSTIREYAKKKGFRGTLMPWDYGYYSEKYKNDTYKLNDEMLKPYFQLESVEKAAFNLANTLYGIEFKEATDIPVYHPDVKVYEVYDGDRFMSLLYMDYFPRASKSGGAWMTSFREQGFYKGKEQRPHVSVVCNFTKPTASTPSLLTFYEVTTLLHEFGHALHGMLAEGRYKSMTGTNVPRDFVELPSQIMENWAVQEEFLSSFARHYQTNEPIPQELIQKIIDSKNFLAGYGSIRQLTFGITDMAWHTLTSIPEGLDVIKFEQEAVEKTSILPAVNGIVFSPSFSHIFAGGYSAGYYSYKWAEVLEADAFSLFLEKGIYNKEVAGSFRKNILSKGNIEDADVLYRNFRGRDPEPEALLRKSGMIK